VCVRARTQFIIKIWFLLRKIQVKNRHFHQVKSENKSVPYYINVTKDMVTKTWC